MHYIGKMKGQLTLISLFLAIYIPIANAVFDDFNLGPDLNRRNHLEFGFNEGPNLRGAGKFHCRREMEGLLNITDEFSNLKDLPPLLEGLEKLRVLFSSKNGHSLILSQEEQIGAGAYGRVFKFYNQKFDRFDAVKLAYTTESFSRRSIKKEYDLLKDLDHPNLPKVYGYTKDPLTAIHMEYIPGVKLKSLIENFKSLDENTREFQEQRLLLQSVYEQLGDVLTYLRSKSIVHSDIHDANILVTPEGKAYLIDFGVSRIDYFSPNQPSSDLKSLNELFKTILEFKN